MGTVNHLLELRQKRGIGAVDLAAAAGVTRQTIYAMEAGNYVPNTVVALKLARALDVKVEDLFKIEDDTRTIPESLDAILLGEPQAAY